MKRLAIALLAFLTLIAPVRAQDDNTTELPWWNDRVFYEIFVRSFYDSDGDGIGDFQGVIEKLDYLNDGDPNTQDDLGVTGIWLMPVMEADSYHGYDVIDYYQVEQDYGTMDDFRQLLSEAHERGIAVIVDMVINHTSDKNAWFIDSAENPDSEFADYYIWSDDDPGFRGPSTQQVWHPLDDRYYYGIFSSGMPDLNYNNPATTQAIYDVADYWLEEVGVDGFRLDAIKHIVEEGTQQENTPATFAWMADYHAYIDSVKPDAFTVGEVFGSAVAASQYVPDQVDVTFNFDLASITVDGVSRRSNTNIIDIQKRALDLYPFGQYGAFLTNHDQNRSMSVLRGDVGAAKVSATILLTNPGVPFIYYGEEIGMMGEKPDEFIRTPMQWTDDPDTAGFTTGMAWEAIGESFTEANVAVEDSDPDSLLNHYRTLIHLRNDSPALRYGDLTFVEASERPIYSFIRHTGDETLLVVINLNFREIEDYELSLEAFSLDDSISATLLLGDGEVSAPTVNAEGGFDVYTPIAILPPRSSFIIALSTP